MKIVNVIDEDIINYKEISMFIGVPFCSGKCWKEAGLDPSICQNNCLREARLIEIEPKALVERYDKSELSRAVVFGGMEPMDSFDDLCRFIFWFRLNHKKDKIIIYTGYREEELKYKLSILKTYGNIIIKFGRYVPNSPPRYDDILGVTLASDNQYARELEC